MKKTAGKIRILYFLLRRSEPATMDALATQIGKSERTARTHLDEIGREYPELGLTRKGKAGVWLEADSVVRERYLKRLIAGGDRAELTMDRRQRHWYILKTLFLERYTYTIQLFADELFCSKSTIVQDLVSIEQWLAQKKLKLCRRQNQGVWVEGEEKNLRLAFKNLLDEMHQTENNEGFSSDIENLDYRIDRVNYDRIAKLLPKVNLFFIQKIVQDVEQELRFYFTEQAFQNLVIHLAIAVKRIYEDKVLDNFQMSEELKGTLEYAAARHMIAQLERALQMRFTEAEVAYAAVHILGAKIQLDENGFNAEELLAHYGEEEVILAKEVVRIAADVLRMDFGENEKLLTRLVQHLRPTIVRMRQGLSLANPMLESIKREYAAAFAAAWACNSAFERVAGLSLNEDEVAYIALHLIVGMQEYQKRYKALVVCASGIGTSQMLVNKLAQYFPNIEVLSLLPYNRLTPEMEAQADIVISTVKLRKSEKMVYVSVLLTGEEREKVRRFLSKVSEARQETTQMWPIDSTRAQDAALALELLTPGFCFTDDDSLTFTALLRRYGAMLEREDFAKTGFTEDVLQREKIGSTYIGHGICIPHSQACFVRRSKIVFVRLREPVVLQQESVRIVLLLCLNFGDAQSTVHFFRNLYAVLSEESSVRVLHEEKNMAKIANILNGGRKDAGFDYIENDCAGCASEDKGGSDSDFG